MKVVAAGTITLCLLCSVALFIPCGGSRVTNDRIQLVREGMSLAEVHGLLGEPNERISSAQPEQGELWGYYLEEWRCTAWLNPIYIQFDRADRVETVWVH